ncbi:hypothetical protein Vadar_008743 [Vaccinium darrowii]|uniref:Uncharacterized protein n=1 Tax=Vaccinium darrowii TaxID=229202 RepID=A0ACB7Y6Z5_9ERIC|nr:hypothetical protein Vadar_008743 [Vaccinium darrowii]
MGFFPSNMILQFAIFIVFITSKCLLLGAKTPRLSLTTDKEALISFKSGIDPETLNPLFTWEKTLSPCNWTGVCCNKVGTRVVELDLVGLGLKGSLSRQIGNLSFLRSLQLQNNHLTGTFPDELGTLFRLRVLNVSFNDIQGTNRLDGMIPGDLSRLQKVKRLDLTTNNLTGRVPPSIYNMSSLVYLNLASNGLWGILPSNVGDTLPNLLSFNLCMNKFSGTIPGSLHNLTRIQVIRMGGNHLHGTVPPGLGNLPELQLYKIGYNSIVGNGDNGLDFLTSLTNSTRLYYLSVEENLLDGVIPESVGNLSKVLSKFYMGGNRIHGRIPASIGHLSGLTLLNLSYNSISYEIPQEIGHLEELSILGLAGNNLSGKIPISIGSLKNLIEIDLSGNELEGTIPTSFENFQRLLSLDLSRNKLNGGIPKGIFNLRSLSTHLNLSNNLLTGPLPQEIGTLNSVVAVDISNNGLSETIPNSIGDCKSLEKLLLANNTFTGPIPDTLSELKGLETLDISSNKLSGSIPDSLQKLQGLQLLNLSFNDLDGEVPVGGVFTNLSVLHLDGNPKLCLSFACEKGRDHRKRLIWVYLIIIAIIASCSIAGLVFYLRKRKPKVAPSSNSFEQQHLMAKLLISRATDNTSINSTNALKGSIGYIPPEYGMGEKPSTMGDVYSYGITLLELFTGRPTHESFTGDLSLKKWVQMAYEINVDQVLDRSSVGSWSSANQP